MLHRRRRRTRLETEKMTDDIPDPTKRASIRLVPPEPDIRLYEDGFEKDALGRESAGRELSNLLDMVDGRLVVAVDGKWGSGKTHFLKCWVGAHEGATVVYFDAFAHDHVSQPLPALVSVVRDRLEEGGGKDVADDGLPERWKTQGPKILRSVYKLARPAISAWLATKGAAGALDVAEDFAAAMDDRDGNIDESVKQAGFWKDEAGRLAAMKSFREALAEIIGKGDGMRPLVIVIDELDRCRPDYALETLEVIKHLFAVDGVHFVLGVNLEAFEHIVRARYGATFPARKYLNRFIQIVFTLSGEVRDGAGLKKAPLAYLAHLGKQMKLGTGEHRMRNFEGLFRLIEEQLKIVASVNDVSLRDVGDIVSRAALAFMTTHQRADERIPGNVWLMEMRVMLTLVISQVVRHDLHRRFLEGNPTDEDLRSYIGEKSVEDPGNLLGRPPPMESEHSMLVHGWTAIRGIGVPSEDERRFRQEHFGLSGGIKDQPKQIHERFLARFVPYGPEAG